MQRILTILFLAYSLAATGQQHEIKLSISIPATSLENALKLLEQQSKMHISYEYTRVQGISVKAHTYKDQPLETICRDLLKGTSLMVKQKNDQLFIGPAPSREHTLSGYVEDAASGERLIGVSLAAPQFQTGTVTNAYGFYSLTLPSDSLHLQLSYMGYQRLDTVIAIGKEGMTFQLQALNRQLEEVTIRGKQMESSVSSSQMSRINLSADLVKSTPRLLGEADLFKTLQLLPGVKQGTEATSALLVRGGTPDQNLILLDGAPLYNPMHLMGIFSTFNTNVLKDVTLYKGAFPARYGGRLSSVIDVSTKDGDMHKIHGDFSVGLLSAQATLEGPIQKGKTTFLISGRRSYPDLLAKAYFNGDRNAPDRLNLYFYDINAKIHHKFSDRDKLYFSFYSGRDKMQARYKYTSINANNDYVSDGGVQWGNMIGTARWNHVYSPKLFSNVMLIGSDYHFKSAFSQDGKSNGEAYTDLQRLKSGIKDYGAKADFEYHPNPAHAIKVGGGYMFRIFTPGVLRSRQTQQDEVTVDSVNNNRDINASEMDLYAEDDWELSSRLKLNAGLHLSAFHVEGRLYSSLQPRLNLRYMLPHDWALKASYSRMAQYVHLLASNSISLPTDLWVPVTDKVKPQESDQFALGIAKNIFHDKFEFSAETYYKRLHHVIEYKEGADYLTSSRGDAWQTLVAAGEGEAYGMELLLQKKVGRLTGWVGYTLSWANRRIPAVNFGREFPYKYDRRHDFHIVGAYKLRKGIELSGSWTFQSAAPFTIPVASYEATNGPVSENGTRDWVTGVSRINGRNNVRISAYHRLDVGVNFIKYKKNGLVRTWNISLLNVYNRFNPFFYYLDSYDKSGPRAKLNAINLIPFMPSISYSLKF
ncbi:outer membrane receptor protein involved in Fe transport [Chitinophaga dinghuensis]|uniref:Outer membrane receptor protein involved in Fe transport n=1 Tax=Chitinophaga dinghuensis TaxID=1539050 RepID=A0A327VQA6_9BACT|nr:TonB-dependent receptor [Chitinophaga dinghuensis]RAJ76614.1 outer membrane receptor protein involved in Fe transport [Chitinophaga dinghuensis]